MSNKDDTNRCVMPLECNRLSVHIHWRYSSCFIEGWKPRGSHAQPSWCTEMPMLPIWTNPISHCKISALREKVSGGGGGGGVGVLSSFLHTQTRARHLTFTPKNIRNFKHPKKFFEILATQKIIPYSVPWPKEETLKCLVMTPKYSPIL